MSLLTETKFGLSLLKKSSPDESYVISPLSISIAIALLHAGAEGSTKQQILKALAGDSTDDQLVQHYKELAESLLKESPVLVRIANRMFIKEGFNVKQSYLDKIEENYAAKAEILDFDNAKACCETVNGFVNEATAGKIQEIVDEENFSEAVSLLVNAIYLDAEWETFFDVDRTKEGDFHVKRGKTKKVQFMNHYGVYHGNYFKAKDCEVLTLEYKDPDYKFSILLPKKGLINKFNLTGFRDSLTPEKLQDLLNSARERFLDIAFPKFKIEIETELTEVLKKLGITEIFSATAHLGGISEGFKVSKIMHKAFIEVDESGTRAAAVTYESLKSCNGVIPVPIKFRADRPFIYVLSYQSHILFTGQYCG